MTEVDRLRKIVHWLNVSNDYWMVRANVPALSEQDAEDEVVMAFNGDEEMGAVWRRAMEEGRDT